jgi:hypothetical protein
VVVEMQAHVGWPGLEFRLQAATDGLSLAPPEGRTPNIEASMLRLQPGAPNFEHFANRWDGVECEVV